MNAVFTVFWMVTATLDPDRQFALVHVPPPARAAVLAVWELDVRLGAIVAATTQPMVGQLRLTWWHDALSALPAAPVGEPLLAALGSEVVPAGISGTQLAALVEGWEYLLDPLPLPDDVLLAYAGRGGAVFTITAALMGTASVERVGEGWALADFAGRCSDADTAARAYALASERLSPERSATSSLPRSLRVLMRLSRGDAAARGRLTRTRWRLLAAMR